jgi:BTB/POZ domain-containing protein 9
MNHSSTQPHHQSSSSSTSSTSITISTPTPTTTTTTTTDVSQDLKQFVNSRELSDVTLFVGPSQVPLYGHRFILATRSEYFRVLLYGPTEEARTGKVYFPDTEPQTMERVLRYLYTGQTDHSVLDPGHVLAVLILANFLQLPGLQKACAEYVEAYVDASNVCRLYETACALHVPQMRDVCASLLMGSFHEAAATEDWLALSMDSIVHLLQSNASEVPEIDLFSAVAHWIRHNNKKESGEGKGEEAARPILEWIRFPHMTAAELVSVVEPTGLVPRDLLYEAYRYQCTGCELHESRGSRARFEPRLVRACKVALAFPSAESRCSGPSQQPAQLGQHWQEGNRFWQDGDEISEVFRLEFGAGGKIRAESIHPSLVLPSPTNSQSVSMSGGTPNTNDGVMSPGLQPLPPPQRMSMQMTNSAPPPMVTSMSSSGNSSNGVATTTGGRARLMIENSRWVVQIRDQLNVNDVRCEFSAHINDVEVGRFAFVSSHGTQSVVHELDVAFKHAQPIEVDRSVGVIKLTVRAQSTVPGGYGSWIWSKGGTVHFF